MAEVRKKTVESLEKIGKIFAALSALVGTVVAIGFLEGNPVSSAPNVDVALEKILEPKATKIGQIVLDANRKGREKKIVTRKDSDKSGGEIVSLEAWTPIKWITVDVTMFRDQNNRLDPSNTNYVDIHIRGCNGERNVCGGQDLSEEEIEIIYGAEDTFTEGDWGVRDSLRAPGFKEPKILITSATKNPTEVADIPDAKQALRTARLWSDIAEIWIGEALRGQVQLPKPQKLSNVA